MLYTAVFARFYRSGLLLVAYGNSWCNEIGKNLCTQPYITLTTYFVYVSFSILSVQSYAMR